MPPPGSAVPALTQDEKMMFARWIDLGCPINSGDDGATPWGWFLDEIRPTLEVSKPRAAADLANLDEIVVGIADANSGIEPGSLSIRATFEIEGRAAGAELADLAAEIDDGIYRMVTSPQPVVPADGEIAFEVRDRQGNTTWVKRSLRSAATPVGPAIECDAVARNDCKTSEDARLTLRLLDDPTRKRLNWKWVSGDETVLADYGAPNDDTDYVLCIYADSGSGAGLAGDLVVGAGSRWTAKSNGFQYRDSSASRDGVKGVKLSAKSRNRGGIKIKAAGSGLPFDDSTIPAGADLTVQWVSSAGPCWQGGE
jgi:hypothetical protein